MIKRCLKKTIFLIGSLFYDPIYVEKIQWRKLLQLIISQKIFRIEAHVPWPVHWSSIVSEPKKITMSDKLAMPGYSIGCYINSFNGIEIGNNVLIGPGVKLISANHQLDAFENHDNCGPIKIGSNCWLGSNSIILPEVTLADHTIVGAGSVVTKSVYEKNCVIAGNPARKIKSIGPYKEKLSQ